MTITLKSASAGQGFTYAVVEGDADILGATATTSCADNPALNVPCRTASLGKDTAVLRLPRMSCDQTVTIEAAGETIALSVPAKSAQRAAKNHGQLVDSFSGQVLSIVDAHMLAVIPRPGGHTVRGFLAIPGLVNEAPSISCFDNKGSALDIKPQLRPGSPMPITENAGCDFTSVQFSIFVPSVLEDFFLVVEFADNTTLNCFAPLAVEKQVELVNGWKANFMPADRHPNYDEFARANMPSAAHLQREGAYSFEYEPLFSIIVPLYNTPAKLFTPMLQSVLDQSYANWQLVLVNSTPKNRELNKLVKAAAAQDARIKVVALDKNYGITGNTNRGVAQADGDFIAFFDHDDVLHPSILFEYTLALNRKDDIDLLYCDEDKLFDNGTYGAPYYKPDFGIDHLRSNNFVCHMLTIRKTLLDEIGPTPDGFDGAQDHWLTLRASELARRIWHVRKVLYHWRATAGSTALDPSSKTYASDAGVRAVQDHLDRIGVAAKVEAREAALPFAYRVRYSTADSPLVSIIIANKDSGSILQQCITSIYEQNAYENFEVLIVENNSTDQATFELYESLQEQHENLRVVTYEQSGFNYSAINNWGVTQANGDYLLFLNNDTKATHSDWLERMVGHCTRDEVGAVGCKLLFPDDTYQHTGLAITGESVTRLMLDAPKEEFGYFSLAMFTRDVSAVTAACMMVRRDHFEAVGGFDEDLAVAFNDVDLCLKLRDQGWLVVYEPEVILYHYESFSRGYDIGSDEKVTRFYSELYHFKSRWAKYYATGDPYFNTNFEKFEPGSNYFRAEGMPPVNHRSKLVNTMANVYHRLQALRHR